ncbi:MAG: glycoside hydrolase [Gemmatimonadales bacterium]|nr:glycoside hydrolase [Gemmatimonadales bacterium]
MRRSLPRPVVAAVAAALLLPSMAAAQARTARPAADTALQAYAALEWRNIGPSRGGRSVAVAGVPAQPLTYFAGYTGGGLWRTDDAGISWRNISDSTFRTGSIGAIAVAPSDANVIYVGTGEHPIRGQSSTYGDGVYKSTDMGRTWANIGLAPTRQISAVRVHPADPDLVYVAAQGDRWKGNAERGIYRSKDGGATWTLVLKGENLTSGASDLSMDPTNPRILYAAFWDHQRQPWFVRSGGPGSGLWKSIDGGDSWTRLTKGLPKLMGKVGVAVSPANPDRVFAIVEAEAGGLYRSDDAGANWRRLSDSRTIQTRSWYYMKVFADPANADVVWVLNAPVSRSIDGGATFQVVPATHGDNHALWINPTDSRYLINGNDGGASISLDGGRSWSTQDNQPTAQFYHVTVDDAYPYKLYSGQQDNSSVVIRSRSDGGSIGVRDWWNGAGCESANIGVSAKSPRHVYGGCYQGLIDELDQETGITRDIMPWPAMNLTERTDSTRYRFNWSAPIVVSQHDPNVIYHGGNVLFRTTDRGTSWRPVSGDLTKNDKSRQGWGGGPITNEGAGGEVYGTIVVIHESSHDARTMYVGTDDGLVQLTRDGGTTWTNVTPPAMTDGLTNEIEVSPHDAATVYVAYRRDRLGDPAPYVFRSTDYGRTWTRIDAGLREGEPVRVVREDTERRGLLYAGTETGAWFSTDNGTTWNAFKGVPPVPVTDLEVRHGDLIAATEGRAFWILDDLSALRQHTADVARARVHLFAPRAAILTSGGGGFGGGGSSRVGRNPPNGATVHFRLAAAPDSTATAKLEFLDARGTVVRTYSSRPAAGAGAPTGGPGGGPGGGGPRLAPKAGLNSFTWDLRRDGPTSLPGIVLFGAPGSGGTKVLPGRYQVRLTIGDLVQTQPLEVRQDPRLGDIPMAVLVERDSIANVLVRRIGEIHDAVNRVRDLKAQVTGIVTRTAGDPMADSIAASGKSLTGKIERVDPRMTTKAQNGQDIINYANGINGQFGFLLGQVEGNPGLTTAVKERLAELERAWATLSAEVEVIETVDVDAFNKLLERANIPGLIVTKPRTPRVIM